MLFKVSKTGDINRRRAQVNTGAGHHYPGCQFIASNLMRFCQLVMDTIVRLAEAERGFLMLRDLNGKMNTTWPATGNRNSINPNEFAISRASSSGVIDSGEPVLTTNAQEDPRFGGRKALWPITCVRPVCAAQSQAELIGGHLRG